MHPNIKFHLISGDKMDLWERLDKGLLDFGILLKKDDPLSTKDYLNTKDLKGKPLIVSRQAIQDKEIPLFLTENKIVATYNLICNATLMVDEGIDYALVLDKIATSKVNEHLCYIPLMDAKKYVWSIIWKKDQMMPLAQKLFLKQIYTLLN